MKKAALILIFLFELTFSLTACSIKGQPAEITVSASPTYAPHITPSLANIREDDLANALKNRLVQLGVPLQAIEVKMGTPAYLQDTLPSDTASPRKDVMITLRSQSENDRITFDDFWNSFLAGHEAELAYLNLGEHFTGYTISILNKKGEEIYGSSTNLSSEMFTQQLIPLKTPGMSEQTTQDKLEMLLDLTSLSITRLEVQTGGIARKNSRYVDLQVSTPDKSMERMNQAANQVSNRLYNAVNELNTSGAAQISIARARISDPQGTLIGEYIYEAETGLQTSKGVEGVDISWFMEGVAATEAPNQTP
jgi:hypothetical protein